MGRTRFVRLLLASCAVATTLVIVEPTPAAACGSTTAEGSAQLTSLDETELLFGFYAGPENATDIDAAIQATFAACQGREAEVHYTTQDGSAVAPSDYASTSGKTPRLCNDDHQFEYCDSLPPLHPVSIPVHDDEVVEPAIEAARFLLTDPVYGTIGHPSNWPVYVIDTDGTQRGSFETTPTGSKTYSVAEFRTLIQVPVFLAGPVDGGVDLAYEVSPYGSKGAEVGAPGSTGVDVEVPADPTISFVSGARVAVIKLTHKNDSLVEGPESLEIRLTGETGPGSSVVVTIEDNDFKTDFDAPVTRFHHPRHKKTYDNDEAAARSLHTWASDPGVAPLASVETALRKKMDDGSCSWWNGSGFTAGPCGVVVWHEMEYSGVEYPEGRYLYIRDLPRKLRPTKGTPINNYRAWTRATDLQENVETTFTLDRNEAMFRVVD